MSRFKIALTALALIVASGVALRALSGSVAHADPMTIYLGNSSKNPNGGILSAQFDAATGQLSDTRVVAVASNSSWVELSPDKATLYALREGKDGGVLAYSVAKDRSLQPLNSQTMGGGLTHLGVDKSGRWLLAAAYGAGNFALFPLHDDGSVGPQKQLIPLEGNGPNLGRQKSAHAHQAVFSPDNARAWVADLGSDKVWLYDFDAQKGALSPSVPPFMPAAPGAGPRHLTFSQNRVYVVNELDNTVTVWADADKTPRLIQTVSSLAPDFDGKSTAAEIEVSDNGRFLYASNRGAGETPSSIAAFQIADDGQLSPIGWTQTGNQPRHFALDPSGQWLLAANQRERAVTVYRVDGDTGALSFHSKLEGVPGEPTCVAWAE